MRREHTVGSRFIAAIQSRRAGVWFTQLQDRKEALAHLRRKAARKMARPHFLDLQDINNGFLRTIKLS